VGPCLTDVAPKDRSQRTARVLTAMMPPERMRRQSSRHSWPGGSIRTSMTATATTRILAQLPHLSREQTRAGSIRRSPANLIALVGAAGHSICSFSDAMTFAQRSRSCCAKSTNSSRGRRSTSMPTCFIRSTNA